MDDYDVNQRIVQVRKDSGLSQAAFGAKLGVSRDVIKNIEYNHTVPSHLLLKAICDEFKVSLDWLKTGEGDVNTTLTANEFELTSLLGLAVNANTPAWKQNAIRVMLKKMLIMTEEEHYRIVAFMEEYLSETEGIVDFRKETKDGE